MTERDAAGMILTVGHSTMAIERFLQLLAGNEVTMVADVRTVPRSRHNPQFNREALPAALASVQIGYRHMPALGGLRRPLAESPNTGWRNASFRGFADYMQTPDFSRAVGTLVEMAADEAAVLMCAEALPWRCHRSLIADALVVRGLPVEHIMGSGPRRPHVLTPWAAVAGGRITYPPPGRPSA